MTFEEACEIVDSMTYKLGSKFSFMREKEIDAAVFRIALMVNDADLWENPETIAHRIPIIHTSYMSFRELEQIPEHIFKSWLRTAIYQIEKHEIAEWLRFNGTRFENPHPEVKYQGTVIFDDPILK